MRRTAPARARHGLTKETGMPFYRQIQHLIRHRIASGEYQPGTQIPSENELCRLLNVSRITLREALRELVGEGLLVKIQGKGTFVASHSEERSKFPYLRITPDRGELERFFFLRTRTGR